MLSDIYQSVGPVGLIMLALVLVIVIAGFKNGGGNDKNGGSGNSSTGSGPSNPST